MGARIGFGLPYFWSNMSAEDRQGEIHYRSRRKDGNGEVELEYGPLGNVLDSKTDFEHFVTERYCLYEMRLKTLMRTEIHHLPWSLQQAKARFISNTLGTTHHIPLSLQPDHLCFSRQIDVLVFPPTSVPERRG